jgi:ABC-type dipeptide/oligopeptide/nickel transport system ATPase component
MEHRGEIIEKAIRNSGIPLTSIARKVGKSRQWVYLLFQNPNVSLNVVIQIGKIIYHDFSGEIKGLSAETSHLNDPFGQKFNEEQSWKEKYFLLMEEHLKLLKKLSKESN